MMRKFSKRVTDEVQTGDRWDMLTHRILRPLGNHHANCTLIVGIPSEIVMLYQTVPHA